VLGAVRAVDPDNLVIAGSPSWSQDVDAAARDPLAFTNLAYTLHYYAGTHRQELRDKADAARAKGLALLVTEFGVVDADGDGPIAREESERWWAWDEAHQGRLDGVVDRRPRREQRGAQAGAQRRLTGPKPISRTPASCSARGCDKLRKTRAIALATAPRPTYVSGNIREHAAAQRQPTGGIE
jgi:hypothetical protein